MRQNSALWYNVRMRQSSYTLMALALLFAAGCAWSDPHDSSSPADSNQIPFTQLKGDPDAYRGHLVTLGGKVLGARRLKDGTRIEILQLPLSSSFQPSYDLSKSQGRFVAMQKEFLDPATVPTGTFITVSGEVAGAVTMPLDDTEYTSPIIEIKNLRAWPREEEASPRMRPYVVPYPYWSPYWRPWPYW